MTWRCSAPSLHGQSTIPPCVIITGGLGPTSDDLTREIVAEAAGVPLDFHQEAWDALLARFPGRAVSETNRKQALAPRGFGLLPNPNGTAPGFQGTLGQALVVALPGPPSELRPMFSASVLPLIAGRFGLAAETDMLWGTALMVPESNLEEALRAGTARAAACGGEPAWTRTDSLQPPRRTAGGQGRALRFPCDSGWEPCACAAARRALRSS